MNRSSYVRQAQSICCVVALAQIWLLLLSFTNAGAADQLVLVSPHWEGIQHEFEIAFKSHYYRATGHTVKLEWMDAGGTSEALRFIRSEFKAKPAGIGIDVFFGGGLDPYLALKQDDLLESYVLPKSLLEKIPPRLGGVPIYDPDHTWYGATLSGFGIIYNKTVLKLTRLPVISTWEDLALPVAFGWVGSSDPRKSGSVHMAYEIILQAYGWDRGWQILTALGANVRNFTNAAAQIPKDVAIGEVAYGLAIDFFAWAQVNEVGADKLGFVMPANLTIIYPDSIGILKGAPNPEVARAFVRFVMSEAGQRLWLMAKGAPGGPQQYQLNRFSVMPSLYETDQHNMAVKLNPFTLQSNFAFDAKKGADRWAIVNDLIGALIIDQKQLLDQAWKAALAAGLTDAEWRRLAAMPVSEKEALDLARAEWRDPALRNQKINEWIHFARAKYQKHITPPLVSAAWMSLLSFGLVALGLATYSWRAKH
ncbi:MAG TPA: extracellular solute-binding protein [Candidatus Binatia bacterium]|jgi:ABC-type Fe3+ transport system substrate-binding protein